MANKTLYVGNLPYSTNAEELVAHFADFGGNNARILEGRGFGFVDIEADHLDAAILAKHNSDLGGRRLTVNEARPKGSGAGNGGGRSFGEAGVPREFPGGGEREFSGGGREYGGRDFGFGGRGSDRGGRGGRERDRRGGSGRY
jgi:RNA recognition motif-containing protein